MQTNSLFRLSSFLILLAFARPAGAQQPEASVTVVDGQEPVLMAYCEYTNGAMVDNGADSDYYDFQGSIGDKVRITLVGKTAGLDPHLVVNNPLGQNLIDTYCDGSSGYYATTCAVRKDLVLDVNGVFRVIVSDAGSNEAGSYLLQIERIPPGIPVLGAEYYTFLGDTISPSSDLDLVAFEGTAGTTVMVVLQGLSAGFDPRLEIFDPAGQSMFNNYCDGSSGYYATTCSISKILDLQTTGTHHIGVSDAGSNETGNYNLSLNCYYGACPESPVGLTGSPATISLASGGAQSFHLDAGSARAGDLYLLLGSVAGFTPGFQLGDHVLPINLDGLAGYFIYGLFNPNMPPLSASMGWLDMEGQTDPAAPPTFTVPAGFNPNHSGVIFHHAALVVDSDPLSGSPVVYTSNPIRVKLNP